MTSEQDELWLAEMRELFSNPAYNDAPEGSHAYDCVRLLRLLAATNERIARLERVLRVLLGTANETVRRLERWGKSVNELNGAVDAGMEALSPAGTVTPPDKEL